MIVPLIIFGCSLFQLGQSELCSEDVTMYDLPKGVLAGMISMATTGVVAGFTGCSDKFTVDPDKIGFWLYNKANHDTPILLNHDNPSQIDPTQKTKIIIHGWTCNITGNGFPQMKDAYLQRYPNANIILIEWTTYSIDLYTNSFCYIPKIAEVIGKFICNLNSKLNFDIRQLHVIGHSLGGQIAGLSGQETHSQCNKKIGRITGLDPAGPLYQMVSQSRRLDASDATVVDVIHSNQAQFGYYGSCGTVDYFPNCGYYQTGCIQITPTVNITAILNVPFSVFACSHQRSIEYFNESILSGGFKSKSCKLCPGAPPAGPCINDIFRAAESTMGEDHDTDPGTESKYHLITSSKTPFSKL